MSECCEHCGQEVEDDWDSIERGWASYFELAKQDTELGRAIKEDIPRQIESAFLLCKVLSGDCKGPIKFTRYKLL